MLNALLRELHRNHKLIRDSKAEIERAPRVLKAHQTKLASIEKAFTDAKEELKKQKAHILTLESQIKSAQQTLAKNEKQLNNMTTQREIEAKQADIRTAQELIATTEDQLLQDMTEVDEKTAKLPEFEKNVVKGKADFATYEKDAAERLVRLQDELKTATKALAAKEAEIPAVMRNHYDRIIKAYGADALAAVESQSCSHCRVGVTGSQLLDLQRDSFLCCKSCGRALYLP
jgi:predicted  nucleic acid-binding Zn-ribbon protein